MNQITKLHIRQGFNTIDSIDLSKNMYLKQKSLK